MTTTATTPAVDTYRWTASTYHRLAETGILTEEDRVELINGQILTMSPIGKLHAAYLASGDEWLRERIGRQLQVRLQSSIAINNISEPEPDLVVVTRKSNYYADALPTPGDISLIVEVADSTLEKDRNLKAPLYAAAGIPEYWIVNIPDRQLEQYLDPADGTYQQTHIWKETQSIRHAWLGELRVVELLP